MNHKKLDFSLIQTFNIFKEHLNNIFVKGD
jgi:hypothetical protein